MSSKNPKEITEFLTIIQKGIKKHGLEKIVLTIQSIELEQTNVFYNELCTYIINLVCKEFDVTKMQLKNFSERGRVTTARKISIILINKHLEITHKEIARIFNRVRQVVYHTIENFNSLDRNKKIDLPFFEIYDKLDLSVQERIKELTGKK